MNQFIEAFEISISSGLFVHEILHGIFAGLFSLIVWYKTKKINYALIPLLLAYILDIDHLVDYWIHYGPRFNFVDFIKMDYFRYSIIALVPFHAWEWILILLPFSIKKQWKTSVTPLILGLSVHYIWDSITVGSFLFYSIIYRIMIYFSLLEIT